MSKQRQKAAGHSAGRSQKADKKKEKTKGGARHERQRAQECGLCALRNVLRPLLVSGEGKEEQLPDFDALVEEARKLEGGEAALREEEVDEDSDVERADGLGNFGVEVLVQSVAACPRIAGERLQLEYWGGRHIEASEGREFGFILGSGSHWWCIRQTGQRSTGWEEVDSLEKSRGRIWNGTEPLREFLRTCEETVLVLYPSQEEEDEEEEAEEASEVAGPGKKGKKAQARNKEREKVKEYSLALVDTHGNVTLVDQAKGDGERLEGLTLPRGTDVGEVQQRLDSGERLTVMVRPGRQSFKKGKILEVRP